MRPGGTAAALAAAIGLAVLPAAASAAITVQNTNPSGAGSLRQAVLDAAPGDTINVPANLGHYAINPGGEIAIAKALTITGAGAASTVIDAGGASRIFNVTAGPFALSGVTLTGGNVGLVGSGGGAALRVSTGSTVALGDCAFTGNTLGVSGAGGFAGGGALRVDGASSTSISNCTFTSNSVTVAGGTTDDGGGAVLVNTGGTATVTGSTFSSNSATVAANSTSNGGGALHSAGATLNVVNSTFTGNTFTVTSGTGMRSSGGGALLNNSGSPLSISGSTIRDNTVTINATMNTNGGGGINDQGAGLTMTGSTVTGNRATVTGATANNGGGGVLINTGTDSSIDSSTVSSNVADVTASANNNGGGGVHSEGPKLTITGSALDGNTATLRAGVASFNGGGGLFTNTGSPVSVSGGSVSGNATSVASGNMNGGGAIHSEGSGPSLTNVTVADNTASPTAGALHGGGAVYTSFGAPSVTFLNSTIAGNSTDGSGAVLLPSGGIALRDSVLASNGAGNCVASGGTFTSAGHNVESLDTCGLNGPGDLKATNPLLGPLGLHGGPTQTMMLLAGSPAIGAGDSCASPDQRGVARPVGAACDAGAVEDQLPGADTGAGSILSATRARLTGTVTPLFTATAYHWDYGPTTAYGTSTPGQGAGDGGAGVPVSTDVSGLRAHTTYRVRLVASNAAGDVVGPDRTFTTPYPDPVVTGFRLSPARFRVASGRTALTARTRRSPRGSAFRFTLNESAVAKIRVYRVLAGRRSGRRCVKPTKRLRSAKRCTRLLRQATFTRRRAKAGANRFTFSGRVVRRALPAGSYRATIVATKAGALKASRIRTASFRIVTR